MNRTISILMFLNVNLWASYVPAVVCFLLLPGSMSMRWSDLVFFPVWFALLVLWVPAAFSWTVLVVYLVSVAVVSVALHREKRAWFWVPFGLFWTCLIQGVMAVGVLQAIGPISYSGIA